MKEKNDSIKKMLFLLSAGMAVSMLGITLGCFFITKQVEVLWSGLLLIACASVWIVLLVQAFGIRLSQFTSELCQVLDEMINQSQAPKQIKDQETLFAKIHQRLVRLYGILQETNRKVDGERQELQVLVSDISHQVRTPVSNMKMIIDTLLTKPMEQPERAEFLKSIRGQVDKLDFLIQALVKTSRLETGAIQLEKEEGYLYDTLAQAMSAIMYHAEQKEIQVSVDCPKICAFPMTVNGRKRLFLTCWTMQ